MLSLGFPFINPWAYTRVSIFVKKLMGLYMGEGAYTRGFRVLKVIKTRLDPITIVEMLGNVYRGALIQRTHGTNRVKGPAS